MPILSQVKNHRPASAAPSAEPIELTIEKLVPGGEGLARLGGKVVFVSGVLAGEKVRVRIREAKKDFARAVVEALLVASPDRVTPPCPVAGRCGGCDWQHLAYPEQLRQKVAMAKDALRRVGGIEWPGLEIEAGKPWGYRSRARLHAASGGRLGFLARGSHDVIPVTACPISHPALEALLAAGVGGVDGVDGSGAGTPGAPGVASSAARSYMAWGHESTAAIAPVAPRDPAATKTPGDDSPADAVAGDEALSAPLEAHILGKAIRFDLRCFFQSNVEMLEALIPFALDGLADGPTGARPGGLPAHPAPPAHPDGRKSGTALDLYCGVGLFGAFLADRFETVLAVESNPASLAFARGNIPGTGHRFLEGRLEDLVAQGRLGTDNKPDAVVLDPPRPGLDAAVRDWLAETKPPKLSYVSCNPVTLARDLKGLLAAGYILMDLRLFDFYPQTAHIEAVARLEIASS